MSREFVDFFAPLHDHRANSEWEEVRLEIRAEAPTRTHGIVTGLPREETIRPPDTPGYAARCELPDGRVLTGGDIFAVMTRRVPGVPSKDRAMRFVFRRVHEATGEITAWGPVQGTVDERWHTFDAADILPAAQAA